MAPSSENLDLLPVSAPVANLSRSSIAPAYHYSLYSTSALTDLASGDPSIVVCMKSEEAQ